jgi:hypothetical protein
VSSTEGSPTNSVALARWEGEGGAEADQVRAAPGLRRPERPPLTDAELEQLRVRVIALENLVIALLVRAPVCQLSLAREMANYILPRPGCTRHPLTLRAADEMLSLVDRANRFAAPAQPDWPASRA